MPRAPRKGPAAHPHRSGFAAIVGRPNVGKSTLLNALIGTKVSIVTPKPQTTRHRILGILTRPHAQIVFVDTPGIHAQARRVMNQYMNRSALSSLDADVLLFVVEALQWTEDDDRVLERVSNSKRPVIAVVNKVDRVREKPRSCLTSRSSRGAQNSRRSCRCRPKGATTSPSSRS
jgi:GTP-binding protein Era